MQLKDKIPADFYKLFSSKYRDSYIAFLLELGRETWSLRWSLSLTEAQAKAVIAESMDQMGLIPSEDEEEDETDNLVLCPSAARFLYNLIRWGWLKRSYEEEDNCNYISFPSYTSAYLETFKKLWKEEDDLGHETIRSVYSLLHTYLTDRDKDPAILEDALLASQRLLELLSNMQDGMRVYFDQLSKQQEILGVQQVLVEELNNTDSRKYAMLTSTDSFYRYKEGVKEMLSRIQEDESRKKERIQALADAIERQFDLIEIKYNRLIEQKSVFASRASARIRYLLREAQEEEDCLLPFISLVRESACSGEMLKELGEGLKLTAQSRILGEGSFYVPGGRRRAFAPVQSGEILDETGSMEEYVTPPEYTRQQIRDFVQANTKDGVFSVTEDTVTGI